MNVTASMKLIHRLLRISLLGGVTPQAREEQPIRCDLVGGRVSLQVGFDASDDQVRPNASLSLSVAC